MPCPSEGELAQFATSALTDDMREHVAQCALCRDALAIAAGGVLPQALEVALAQEAPGRYTALELIGRGGQALVWRVFDQQLQRDVALKELQSETPRARQRFVREARAMAMLSHPALLPVFDVGCRRDGRPFYTMPVVTGQTVRQCVRAQDHEGAWAALVPHILRAAEAIAFAHAKGVIHRDITSSNILIGAYGETYVIDWGLSRRAEAGDEPMPPALGSSADLALASPDPQATLTGTVLGTPGYMSPEQSQGTATDERVDVWGLGAVLFEVLWGRAPGNDVASFSFEHPDAPKPLIAIVRRALTSQAADRYARADELADDLRRFLSFQRVHQHQYSTWERTRLWIRRNNFFFRAAVMVSASLALGLLLTTLAFVKERNAKRASRLFAAQATAQGMRAKLQLARSYVEKAHDLIDGSRYLDAALYASAALPLMAEQPEASVSELAAMLRGIAAITAHQPVGRVVARREFAPSTMGFQRIDMAWSHAGDRLAVVSNEGVDVLDDAGRLLYSLPSPHPVFSVAWGKTSALLAVTNTVGLALYEGPQRVRAVEFSEPLDIGRTSALFDDLSGVTVTTTGKVQFLTSTWAPDGPAAKSKLRGPVALDVIGDRFVVMGALDTGGNEVWDRKRRSIVRTLATSRPPSYSAAALSATALVVRTSEMHLLETAAFGPRSQFVDYSVEAPDMPGFWVIAAINDNLLVEMNTSGQVAFRTAKGELLAETRALISPGHLIGVASRPDGRTAAISGSQLVIFDLRLDAARPRLARDADLKAEDETIRYMQCSNGNIGLGAANSLVWLRRSESPAVKKIVGDGLGETFQFFDEGANVVESVGDNIMTWKRTQGSIALVSSYPMRADSTVGARDTIAALATLDHRQVTVWHKDQQLTPVALSSPAEEIALNDSGSRLLALQEGQASLWEVLQEGTPRMLVAIPLEGLWRNVRYWNGYWVLGRQGEVRMLKAETLETAGKLPLAPGEINHFSIEGALLGVNTVKSFQTWNLARLAIVSRVPLGQNIVGACLLDGSGDIAISTIYGDYYLLQVPTDFGRLPSLQAEIRATIGPDFIPELFTDE